MDQIKNHTKKIISHAQKLASEVFQKISLNQMTLSEQTFLIKRLSFLIKAGIPILDSLIIIKEQTKKNHHLCIINTIISDISNGQELSRSLQKFNKIFGDFSINIIAFGESTGMLSDNLDYLANELKKKDMLRKKIIGAFIYPVIVVIATLSITTFLMLYLFPKISPVFKSLHITLPLSTRLVMWLSNFLQNYGLYLFILIAMLIIYSNCH
jgi:type II secretory pathway component PulF